MAPSKIARTGADKGSRDRASSSAFLFSAPKKTTCFFCEELKTLALKETLGSDIPGADTGTNVGASMLNA